MHYFRQYQHITDSLGGLFLLLLFSLDTSQRELLQQQDGAAFVLKQQGLELFHLLSKPQNLLVPCVEALCSSVVVAVGTGGKCEWWDDGSCVRRLMRHYIFEYRLFFQILIDNRERHVLLK